LFPEIGDPYSGYKTAGMAPAPFPALISCPEIQSTIGRDKSIGVIKEVENPGVVVHSEFFRVSKSPGDR